MAIINLYLDELREGSLPPFCMRCGQPSELIKHKQFSWGPAWVMLLLGIGAMACGPLFFVALICIPIFLRRMTVPVPLCRRHRYHWLPVQIVLFGGLGVVASLLFAAVVLFVTSSGPYDAKSQWVGLSCFGAGAFLVVMLFPAALLQTRVIRPLEITEDRITLTCVSREFVEWVRESRDAPMDVRPARDAGW